MTRQFGADRRKADERGDLFAEDVGRALSRVARMTARQMSSTPTELDLAGVRGAWRDQVTSVLLPTVEREWLRAADETWRAVADVLGRAADAPVVVAAAIVAQTPGEALVDAAIVGVPHVTIEAARAYLEVAQNRLVGIGDSLWGQMREQLVEGLTAGEGTDVIARRLRTAADLTKARASVVARTEVIGATNRGAYAQMLSTGLGGTKTWLATGDKRTRPSHAAASGQTADMPGSFTVGGMPMDGPHDPLAPAEETISCRCTLTYDLDLDSVEHSRVDVGVEAVAEPGLTDEQYAMLTPGRRRAESTIKKTLGSSTQGENVLAKIKQFTQTRGGVVRFRKEVEARLAGESTPAVAARVDDFLGAMNNYPVSEVPQLYRGIGLKPPPGADVHAWFREFESSYRVGSTLDMNVSSFTSSDRLATQFMSGTGGGSGRSGLVHVKIVVDGQVHALPVEQLSKFAYEKEWIAAGRFRVTSFERPEGKRTNYVIHIQQIETLTSRGTR